MQTYSNIDNNLSINFVWFSKDGKSKIMSNHQQFFIKQLQNILLLFCLVFTQKSNAQTYMETFGQNRVQLRKYNWNIFETEHLKVYHYDAAGRQLARFVAEQAENDIKIIEQKISDQFPERFSIILYNNYDEYLQTNVGKKYESQIQDIPAGTVDLVGDKLVVYFTGEHKDLRKQLRSGMSRVVMQKMLFGENFRDMVKNAVTMNLPTWTVNGYIDYLVDGWDAPTETAWKNILLANWKTDFYKLTELAPDLSGKAFWNFTSQKYGQQTVQNLLYAMQIKNSLNNGIKMTLGMKMNDAFDSLIQFYKLNYVEDSKIQELPENVNQEILSLDLTKKNSINKNFVVSPKGNSLAYVSWKNGRFDIVLNYLNGQQAERILLSGGELDYNEKPDPNYPILAWSQNGYKLAIVYKKKFQTRIRTYNSIKGQIKDVVIPKNRFERILSMCFLEDEESLVLSAIKKSKTDLYEFRLKGNKVIPITNDLWDDEQPSFVVGGDRKGILFLSNRPKPNINVPISVNELPTSNKNIFFFDYKTRSTKLLSITSFKSGNISNPIQYGQKNFAFLCDSNGVTNQYVVNFLRTHDNQDSCVSYPVTNYTQSILNHQYSVALKKVYEVVPMGKRIKVFQKSVRIPADTNDVEKKLTNSRLLQPEKFLFQKSKLLNNNTTDFNKSNDVNIAVSNLQTGNYFQTEYEDELTSTVVDTAILENQVEKEEEKNIVLDDVVVDSVLVDSMYIKMKAQKYRHSFKPDFFSVKLDNSILFNKYQPSDALGNLPAAQSMGGMLSISLNDALENHRFTGGYRLPINFQGSTYFFQYENFKNRIDWNIMFVRTQNTLGYDVAYADSTGQVVLVNNQIGKVVSSLLQGGISYPLDRRRSVKVTSAFRQDRLTFQARDTLSLVYEMKDQNKYWNMTRAEFVFDNSSSPTLNIRYGLRYKFFGEYFYKLSQNNGGFFNFGTDIRSYQKIKKHFILATRLAYAHSIGNYKVNYMLGGVDNWLMSSTNSIPPPSAETYAFQTLATNLRGYEQNSRNGNSYAVFNGELRLPIASTFFRRPVRSSFLSNFQLIGFLDIGNAWSGFLPSSPENSQGYTYQNNWVTVKFPPPNQGMAIGFGSGIRTMFLGYFVRLDAGWNIEGKTTPLWHFSIGTDF